MTVTRLLSVQWSYQAWPCWIHLRYQRHPARYSSHGTVTFDGRTHQSIFWKGLKTKARINPPCFSPGFLMNGRKFAIKTSYKPPLRRSIQRHNYPHRLIDWFWLPIFMGVLPSPVLQNPGFVWSPHPHGNGRLLNLLADRFLQFLIPLGLLKLHRAMKFSWHPKARWRFKCWTVNAPLCISYIYVYIYVLYIYAYGILYMSVRACVFICMIRMRKTYIYIIMYVCVHEYIHMDLLLITMLINFENALYSTVLGNVQTQTKDRII